MIFIIDKCLHSFKYAFRGIYLLYKNENNAKVHFMASCICLATATLLQLQPYEWIWIFLCISLVWMAEGFNTAIEKLVNIVSPEFNKEAGNVKDIAAGAVLIAAVFALITGTVIFLPKIILLFN